MNEVTFACYSCGHRIPLLSAEKILKKDACPQCGNDLHCCRNCRFFDTSVHNECRETQTEWVRAKDKANFCEYFQPTTRVDLTGKSGASENDARKKFDSLFKI